MSQLKQQALQWLKRHLQHPMPLRRHIFVVMASFMVILSAVNVYSFYVVSSDVERISARYQLEKVASQLPQLILQAGQASVQFDANTHIFIGADNLPRELSRASRLKAYKTREFSIRDIDASPVYMMKVPMPIDGQPSEVFILHYDELFEVIEDELVGMQQLQMLMTVGLLLLSLLVLLKVSGRLTFPLSALAEELSQRQPDDLTSLPAVAPQAPSELGQLVDSVNQYQLQIRELLARERAFNRYASHELRSPLMVMQGAANLLKHSSDPAFVAKQRKRIEQACGEMHDFVTTLLALNRDENQQNLRERAVSQDEVADIVAAHQHLLEGKAVRCHVHSEALPKVVAPESAVKILLGNLVKNAFTHTEQGEVIVSLHRDRILVSDTGCGLGKKPAGVQGYGLGLLIANDICRKYGWQMKLKNNAAAGCDATVFITKRANRQKS